MSNVESVDRSSTISRITGTTSPEVTPPSKEGGFNAAGFFEGLQTLGAVLQDLDPASKGGNVAAQAKAITARRAARSKAFFDARKDARGETELKLKILKQNQDTALNLLNMTKKSLDNVTEEIDQVIKTVDFVEKAGEAGMSDDSFKEFTANAISLLPTRGQQVTAEEALKNGKAATSILKRLQITNFVNGIGQLAKQAEDSGLIPEGSFQPGMTFGDLEESILGPLMREGNFAGLTSELVQFAKTDPTARATLKLHGFEVENPEVTLEREKDEAKKPVKQKLAEEAAKRGGTPEQQRARKLIEETLTTPQTSVTFEGEKTASKVLAKGDIETAKAFESTGFEAQANLARVEAFQTAAKSGKFTTGIAGDFRQSLAQVAELFGFSEQAEKITGGLLGDPAVADVMQSTSNQMALSLVSQLKNIRAIKTAITLVKQSVPSLSRTAEGNEIISEIMKRTGERAVVIGEMATKFLDEFGTPRPKGKQSLFNAIAELNKVSPVIDEDLRKRIKAGTRNAPKSFEAALAIGSSKPLTRAEQKELQERREKLKGR